MPSQAADSGRLVLDMLVQIGMVTCPLPTHQSKCGSPICKEMQLMVEFRRLRSDSHSLVASTNASN